MTTDIICFNCDHPQPADDMLNFYCSIACAQEAELIRYARGCNEDGRIKDPLVVEAIIIKLAHVMNGGYDRRARKIPESVRKEIINRDKGKCQECGKPCHSNELEIDHINGPSIDANNLQVLCNACHNQKTMASIVPTPITHDVPLHMLTRHQRIMDSINATLPLRECHDHLLWKTIWRTRKKERKEQANNQ